MNAFKLFIIASFLLSTIGIGAQKINNPKTETVHIKGNCGMCKTTIEKAGFTRKEAKTKWNQETQMATITYDSVKTSKNDILKRVALAGYDNELFSAPDDTYDNLPACCHYQREHKEIMVHEQPKMEMREDHSEHVKMTKMDTQAEPLHPVFEDYFQIKNALVQSDADLVVVQATDLVQSIENVNMSELETETHEVWMEVMKALKTDAANMAVSDNLTSQRALFISLSENMYPLLKIAQYQAPVYYQFCPMANDGKGAHWLSTEDSIQNPYYGAAMLSCGKIVETIE